MTTRTITVGLQKAINELVDSSGEHKLIQDSDVGKELISGDDGDREIHIIQKVTDGYTEGLTLNAQGQVSSSVWNAGARWANDDQVRTPGVPNKIDAEKAKIIIGALIGFEKEGIKTSQPLLAGAEALNTEIRRNEAAARATESSSSTQG